MIDRTLARGLFLAAIALAFGISSLQYKLGSLAHAGAGLFPLLISAALLTIALATIVQSRFLQRKALDIAWKNIGLILLGLGAFAAISIYLNMSAGIVAMVFIVTYAGTSYSWRRNLVIAGGLLAVAFTFQRLLGLDLPLY